MKKCTLGLGCFWKPEENFKNKPGIIDTEVGYAGGHNAVVSYEEVCKGNTGHAEVVRLTFDDKVISFFADALPTKKSIDYTGVYNHTRHINLRANILFCLKILELVLCSLNTDLFQT